MLYSRDDSGENFSVVKRRGSHIGGSENGGTTVLTAIKNAKATFLLITSVFSNVFRQTEFYLEEKSFLNKLTTFCIILVDDLIFKI